MNYLFILLLSTFSGYYQPTETVDITVIVSNINTFKGNVELGVFNTSKSFLKQGEEYKTYSKKASSSTLIFQLKGLKKDEERVLRIYDKTKANCLVTNSMKTEVTIVKKVQ